MPSDIISKDDLVVTDIGNRRGERHKQRQREDRETVKQRETESGREGERQRHMQRQREDRERERGERQTKRLYVS